MATRRSVRGHGEARPIDHAGGPSRLFRSIPEKYRTALLAAVIVAIAANAYAPVFGCGYIWDDDSYVTQNPTLHTADGLRRIWLELGATPQYYPLVFTSFWIETQLFGLNPAVSHAINLLLHCAAALLAWRILLALGAAAPLAWTAALVFAVHPVHVESVAWITERKNVLSGVCYLAALWAYLQFDKHERSPDETQRYRYRWSYYALALFLFVAALLSKTVTCSLPVVILLLIWCQFGRVTYRDVARVVPFLLLGIALGLVTVWLERHKVGAVGEEFDLSPLARVLLAGRAAWFYAGKLLWPHPLVFIYPRWHIDAAVAWQYLFPAAALALVVALWCLRAKLGRGPLVAILCFGVSLAPALGFVSVFPMKYSFVADHFQYLASLFFIALVTSLAWKAFQAAAPPVRGFVATICLAWIAMLPVLTWQQVHDYADLQTLWINTLAKNPDAWLAAHNLGVMHLERGEYPAAERYFRQAIERQPKYARAINNLGLLQLYKRDLPGAIARFEEAIAADPDFVGSRLNLCRVKVAEGQIQAAADQFLHALAVEPSLAESQESLAFDILHAADPATAQEFLDDALRIKPNWPRLVNELAWILATSPSADRRNPARAMSLAQQAVEMSGGRDARTLDCLAAAYAAAGDYPRAVDVAGQALAQARQAGNAALAAEIESRIETFERGEPCRSLSQQAN